MKRLVVVLALAMLPVACAQAEPDWFQLGRREWSQWADVPFEAVEPLVKHDRGDCVGVVVQYPGPSGGMKGTVFFRGEYVVGRVRGGEIANPVFDNCFSR